MQATFTKAHSKMVSNMGLEHKSLKMEIITKANTRMDYQREQGSISGKMGVITGVILSRG